MAWHQQGDKSLSGAMMVSLLMHICATRPQWVRLVHKQQYTVMYLPCLPYWFLWVMGVKHKYVILKFIQVVIISNILCEIALR